MRGRLTALLVVALVAGAALPAAAAPDLTGALVSVGPPSQSVYEVGDLVSIPYEVDPSAGDLQSIFIDYEDQYGGYSYLYAAAEDDAPIAQVVADTVTSDWRPGDYAVEYLSLSFENYGISYRRDGVAYQWDDDGEVETAHSVDITGADFSILNDDADITAPVLESFELVTGGEKHFGDEVSVAYEASDVSGIAYAYFAFLDPNGRRHLLFDTAEWDEETGERLPPDGIATGDIDITWASGTSELVMASVVDASSPYEGIESYYKADGTTSTYPQGFEPPPPGDLDFAGAALQVQNAEYDVDAPVLTSIARTSPDTVYQGESLGLAYGVEDPHFDGLHVGYSNGPGGEGYWGQWHDVPATGQVNDVLWDMYEPGSYRFDYLQVHDSGTGGASFYRDGTTATYDWVDDDWVYGTHGFDLAPLDFTIEAWPFEVEDARTGYEFFLAPEVGKVRFDSVGAPHVQDGVEFTSTGASSWAFRYTDTDFAIAGTFDEVTGDYTVLFRLGNRADVLTNAGGAF